MPGRAGFGSRRARGGRHRGRRLRRGRWRRQEPGCPRGRCRWGFRRLGGAMPRHQGTTGDKRDRNDREHQNRWAAGRHHQQAEGDRDGDQAENPRVSGRFRHPQHRARRPRCRAPEPVDEQARAEHDEHRRQRHPERDAAAGDPGEDHRDGRHRRHRNPGGPGQPLTQPTGRPQHRGPEVPGQHGPGRSGQQRADQVRYHETPPNIESGAGHAPSPATDEHRRRRTVPYAVKLAPGALLPPPLRTRAARRRAMLRICSPPTARQSHPPRPPLGTRPSPPLVTLAAMNVNLGGEEQHQTHIHDHRRSPRARAWAGARRWVSRRCRS